MDYSVFLGLLTAGAGLFFGKPRKGGSSDAWQSAAETYGLLHKPSGFWSGPKLTGPLDGNELTVDMRNRSSASAETRFRLQIPSRNLGMRLRKKTFWNSFRPRAITGDSAFDRQVVVEGRNDYEVNEFLTPERRAVIQGFLNSFKGAVITDDEISFKTRGYVKKSDDMLGALESMSQVATALADDPVMAPVSAAASAAAIGIAMPDPAEPVVPEPEIEPEPEPAPEPEFAQADEPDVSEEPELKAVVQEEAPVAEIDTPGAGEFCEKVFAPGALSFSANQIFKETFEGQRVVWTGTLQSAKPFTFDFDFGSGGGTKAVLTILEDEAPGAGKVEAVIGLPADVDGLDERIGEPVAFAGRLLKVDGLARRVIVADAELRP